MRRLRIANGLAEHCISPAQGRRADFRTGDDSREPLQLRRLAHSCGLAQFIAAVKKRDPLPGLLGAQGREIREVGELDEELLDLAWRLLRWHPHERLTAAEALRHPALAARERPYREGGYREGAATDATPRSDAAQLRYSGDLDPEELHRLTRAICDGQPNGCTHLIAPAAPLSAAAGAAPSAAGASRAARPPPEQERGVSSWLSFDWRALYKRAGGRAAA